MRFYFFLATFCFSYHSIGGYSCSLENASQNNCPQLIKLNARAGLGSCLPQNPPESREIFELFERNNIRVSTGIVPETPSFTTNLTQMTDARDPRILALARVVEAFDKIGGGAMTALKDGDQIDVIFASNRPHASRRYGPQIQIAPGTQNMTGTLNQSLVGGQDNLGVLTHELAHYVGGNNDQKILIEYQRHMRGERCPITRYATDSIGEEFAEALAAYILTPERFQGRRGVCEKTFNFMKNLFNEPDMQPSCESRQASYGRDDRPIRFVEQLRRGPRRGGRVSL